VFHDSRRVLQALLEAGADPNIRSSYNKNAWDLAKVCIAPFLCHVIASVVVCGVALTDIAENSIFRCSTYDAQCAIKQSTISHM